LPKARFAGQVIRYAKAGGRRALYLVQPDAAGAAFASTGEPKVKHAGAEALAVLSEFLQKLRNRPSLIERKPGIFYVRGRAFLHFHEDRAGLFADLRQGGDWLRLAVNDVGDRERLLVAVDRTINEEKTARAAPPL
jgi:hypothetical protein